MKQSGVSIDNRFMDAPLSESCSGRPASLVPTPTAV